LYLQFATHQWIQTTPHTCNERTPDSFLFTLNKISLKIPLQRFVTVTFTLLLEPFESKLVNNQSHGESLKIHDNPAFMPFSLLKQWFNDFQEVFKDWQRTCFWSNLDSKGTKISVNIGATNFINVSFKNISFSMNRRQSKIRSLHMYSWIHWCVANCT